MPTKYDATNPEHFALFLETDEQLRQRGIRDEELVALREAQYSAPPATSADDVKARQAQPKQAVRKQDEGK